MSAIFVIYTVKIFSEIIPKVVGQLKIQMDRTFFQRYSQKYIYIFNNLSGKRSKKSEQIFVFVE